MVSIFNSRLSLQQIQTQRELSVVHKIQTDQNDKLKSGKFDCSLLKTITFNRLATAMTLHFLPQMPKSH